MSTLPLKSTLERLHLSQRKAFKGTGMSPAATCNLINHGEWPQRINRKEAISLVGDALREAGATEDEITTAFARPKSTLKGKETKMLRKQGLFPKTKLHFRLPRDPFGEVTSPEDVFRSPEIVYVRESMHAVAKFGGFLAVVGESGSGKSTLRRELIDRIARDEEPIKIIEPYVLGMEDSDKAGRTIKASHLAEAIVSAVAPLEQQSGSPEARFRQLHRVLRDNHLAGFSHCLMIEEAHCLPLSTLKHLKRFLELEHGLRKLLSVILLGQPELEGKLSESSPAVREVTQRCEMVMLHPMNGSLADYVRFRFERVSADADKIFEDGAIEALRDRLAGPTLPGGKGCVSRVYPLAVGNILISALNLAADVEAPRVSADFIRQA